MPTRERMLSLVCLCCFLLVGVRVGYTQAQPDIHYEIVTRLLSESGADVSWSPDGSRLAVSSGGWSTSIWDTTSWKPQLRIRQSSTVHLAWSPDGEMLARTIHRDDETILIWNAGTGELIDDLSRPRPPDTTGPIMMRTLAWSPDGTKIATDSGIPEDNLLIWDWVSGDAPQVLVDGFPEVSADEWTDITYLAWSRNGRWLLGEGVDGNNHPIIRLWDATTGNTIRTISPGFLPIWTKENRQFAGISWQDETPVLHIWDVETGDVLSTLEVAEGGLKTLAWNGDEEMIAGAGGEHLYLWDVANEIEYEIEVLPLNDIHYVEWRPHGDQLAVADYKTGVWILDFEFDE